MINPKITEAQTQKLIIQWLKLHNIFHWRSNTGALSIGSTNTLKKRFVRFGGMVGSPDIFAVVEGQIYGIEVKSPKGKQSKNQKWYQEAFELAGGIYILAYSIDDVERDL